jgi:hypothetical protein
MARSLISESIKSQDLVTLGFERCADGTLVASGDATITLAYAGHSPVCRFYQLTIGLPGGAISAVLADVALKITREGKP